MTFDEYVQAVDGAVRESFAALEVVMANRPSDRFGSVAWRRKTGFDDAAGQALPVVRAIELDNHRAAFLFFSRHWQQPDRSLTVAAESADVPMMANEVGRYLSA